MTQDAQEIFQPRSVGEVETIGPETTRVGDTISHKGIIYTLAEIQEGTL